jgi:hypothetical protein
MKRLQRSNWQKTRAKVGLTQFCKVSDSYSDEDPSWDPYVLQMDNSPPYVGNEDMTLDDPSDDELKNEDISINMKVHLSWLLLILLNGSQLEI